MKARRQWTVQLVVPVQCPVHEGSASVLWPQCNFCVMATVCCCETGLPFWATSQLAQFNTLHSLIELCYIILLGKPPSAVTASDREVAPSPCLPTLGATEQVLLYIKELLCKHLGTVSLQSSVSFEPLFICVWSTKDMLELGKAQSFNKHHSGWKQIGMDTCKNCFWSTR